MKVDTTFHNITEEEYNIPADTVWTNCRYKVEILENDIVIRECHFEDILVSRSENLLRIIMANINYLKNQYGIRFPD
jgi:hypothetical protein